MHCLVGPGIRLMVCRGGVSNLYLGNSEFDSGENVEELDILNVY